MCAHEQFPRHVPTILVRARMVFVLLPKSFGEPPPLHPRPRIPSVRHSSDTSPTFRPHNQTPGCIPAHIPAHFGPIKSKGTNRHNLLCRVSLPTTTHGSRATYLAEFALPCRAVSAYLSVHLRSNMYVTKGRYDDSNPGSRLDTRRSMSVDKTETNTICFVDRCRWTTQNQT